MRIREHVLQLSVKCALANCVDHILHLYHREYLTICGRRKVVKQVLFLHLNMYLYTPKVGF